MVVYINWTVAAWKKGRTKKTLDIIFILHVILGVPGYLESVVFVCFLLCPVAFVNLLFVFRKKRFDTPALASFLFLWRSFGRPFSFIDIRSC